MKIIVLAGLFFMSTAAIAQEAHVPPVTQAGDASLTQKCEGNLSMEQSYALARKWIDAWNSTSVDRVMALYTPDMEFRGVGILTRKNKSDPSGVLHGQADNRMRWFGTSPTKSEGYFRLIDVFAGVRSIAVHYTTLRSQPVTEVMEYTPDCKIERSNAFYGPFPAGFAPAVVP
jgi:hypothetical protein